MNAHARRASLSSVVCPGPQQQLNREESLVASTKSVEESKNSKAPGPHEPNQRDSAPAEDEEAATPSTQHNAGAPLPVLPDAILLNVFQKLHDESKPLVRACVLYALRWFH